MTPLLKPTVNLMCYLAYNIDRRIANYSPTQWLDKFHEPLATKQIRMLNKALGYYLKAMTDGVSTLPPVLAGVLIPTFTEFDAERDYYGMFQEEAIQHINYILDIDDNALKEERK